MLDDLIKSRVLIGKTREELIAALGPGDVPNRSGSLDLRPQLEMWDFVFSAGCRDLSRGFDPYGIDCSYVCIRFGPDGRVSEAGVVSQ